MLSGQAGVGFGMLVVETIAKMRRAYFPDRNPITRIGRELRVSRSEARARHRVERRAGRFAG